MKKIPRFEKIITNRLKKAKNSEIGKKSFEEANGEYSV